jgi:hypothetical protein
MKTNQNREENEAMFSLKMTRVQKIAAAALAVAPLVFSPVNAAAQHEQDALAKGNLYYSSDDITDKAAMEYRSVKNSSKYKGTKTGGTAQYLYASYYHRKFYIVRERMQKDDEWAIHKAEKEYGDYIRDYKHSEPPEYLSDSYFNLALIWLEYGHGKDAVKQLNSLRSAARQDPSVYIYDVIWSPHSKDRVEGYYNAEQLADVIQNLIERGLSTQGVVAGLRDWCRNHRQG